MIIYERLKSVVGGNSGGSCHDIPWLVTEGANLNPSQKQHLRRWWSGWYAWHFSTVLCKRWNCSRHQRSGTTSVRKTDVAYFVCILCHWSFKGYVNPMRKGLLLTVDFSLSNLEMHRSVWNNYGEASGQNENFWPGLWFVNVCTLCLMPQKEISSCYQSKWIKVSVILQWVLVMIRCLHTPWLKAVTALRISFAFCSVLFTAAEIFKALNSLEASINWWSENWDILDFGSELGVELSGVPSDPESFCLPSWENEKTNKKKIRQDLKENILCMSVFSWNKF